MQIFISKRKNNNLETNTHTLSLKTCMVSYWKEGEIVFLLKLFALKPLKKKRFYFLLLNLTFFKAQMPIIIIIIIKLVSGLWQREKKRRDLHFCRSSTFFKKKEDFCI